MWKILKQIFKKGDEDRRLTPSGSGQGHVVGCSENVNLRAP